ncbi:hypothetical protein EJ03DRAFT_328643 [Teratosphaeria nubilosa]|uniref:Uncharacterized protein n=1 Tax=Teratosphaeria nubilosa TaxID=161662 RepID=A0A6G1L640_9PEZI|nr:hypothetical protein EJ03DRAFT_328643 [Teratosphaeria nubilosa]
MAVQRPEPAWPATLRIKKRTPEPFDSEVLIAKLEAHLLEQDRKRAAKQAAPAAARTIFVPRTAAKHSASTTTPMLHTQTDQPPRKDSANSPPPLDIEDLNPKAVQAARSVGMSDAEILAQAAQDPHRRSTEQPRHLDDRRNQPACDVRRSTSHGHVGVYRPGDAAKRNGQRRTLPVLPQQTPNATVSPHDYDVAADRRPDPLDAFESTDEPAETRPSLSSKRPALKFHDRANWAQESECGDGTRHLLHWRVRKASNEMGTGTGTKSSSPPGPENLVGEAMKQMKEERSSRRRSRVMGFFKRP